MRILPPLLAVSVLALAACSTPDTGPSTPPPTNTFQSSSSVSSFANAYINDHDGYSIGYPDGWTIEKDSKLTGPNYEATGTAFVFDAKATKSALSEAKLHIATLPTCPAQTDPQKVVIGSLQFQRSTWSDVGAGNLYEGVTYTMLRKVAVGPATDGTSCQVITVFTHSCNLGSDCGPERSQPFDKQALIQTMEDMAGTFRLQ